MKNKLQKVDEIKLCERSSSNDKEETRIVVYTFGCYYDAHLVKTVEKLSPTTNKQITVVVMLDNRESFCTCEFIDKIYI